MTTKPYLNMGCGRLLFPIPKGDPRVDHLDFYLPPEAHTGKDQWLNVDSLPLEGVDQQMDAFCYPWPWPDNTFEIIWLSHLCEHIPHQAVVGPGASRDLLKAAQSDGFYAFFYEVWRVLKPGGVVHVVSPYAFSRGGMADPQHTRYLVPATFGYLKPQEASAPHDYQIPFDFDATGEPVIRLLTMVDDEISARAAAIVPKDRSEAEREEYFHAARAELLMHRVQHELNIIQDFGVSLKAAKG